MQFILWLKLTYGSVFSQEAIVIDYRIRVEVDEHWSKCSKDAWDGISTKSRQWNTTGGRACVDLHTIVDTCGVCWRRWKGMIIHLTELLFSLSYR